MRTTLAILLLCASTGAQAQSQAELEHFVMSSCRPCDCQAYANRRGMFASPPSKECPAQRVYHADGSVSVLEPDGKAWTEPAPENCNLSEKHVVRVCQASGAQQARMRCTSYTPGRATLVIECSKDGEQWHKAVSP
jgi:hypothetical protein